MGPSVRVRMIRDRFVTGHQDYELRRHLDSVPPDMPIQEIVDRCRVWESHSHVNHHCYITPTLTGSQLVCSVSDQSVNPVDPVTAVGATPSVGLIELETLLQKLLQNVAPTSVFSVRDQPVRPLELTALETLLQRVLPCYGTGATD